jgi:serine/threonine protein kinase
VPDHVLLCRIGAGSYGEVWLARNVLGLMRAVKVVCRDRFQDARPYEREFIGILRVEPLSRAHEGLVDILHVGRREPEGYFYYIMELADDAERHEGMRTASADGTQYQPLTLARKLKHGGRLNFQECVQLGLGLSSALSHLHQHGLMHRDVKPSNILYVGGAPKLGDIGLVGEAGASASYVGTEGYIPPEGPGTAQADVFGLGKVLYEASTGLDRLSFPALPNGATDAGAGERLAELNEVFVRACAADPQARYQTAEALHADLALLHRGQSVRKQRTRERRRHRLSVTGYVLAATAGLAVGALWSPRQRGAPAEAVRSTLASQKPVDLSGFYNAALTDDWMRDFEGNNLATLPPGWHRFARAYFMVHGLIQLRGAYSESRQLDYPAAVEAIPVRRRCTRLYFLHGTVWPTERSQHVAAYVVHYFDGRQEEIPVRYGEEIKNWWWASGDAVTVDHAALAWIGTNGYAGSVDKQVKVRLYCLTWNNPFPDEAITSLDFVSTGSASCPFLVAVTAE